MTLSDPTAFWLLALHPRWKHMGDHFAEGGNRLDTSDIFLIVVFIALATVAVFVLRRLSPDPGRRVHYNDPRQLFRELCRCHGLGSRDRRLLKQLAAQRGLSHRAMIFVMPECFDATKLPPELAAAGPQLAELRMRLFQDA